LQETVLGCRVKPCLQAQQQHQLHRQAALRELLKSQAPAAREASSSGLWLGAEQRLVQVHLLLWWQQTNRALPMLPTRQQQEQQKGLSSRASSSTAAQSQTSCHSQLHM
jgi:hypothetical protein